MPAQRNLLGVKILRELFRDNEDEWRMIEFKAIKALLNLLSIPSDKLEYFISLVKIY